jgi:hypothetical protein
MSQLPGFEAIMNYEIVGSPEGREHRISGIYCFESRYQATTGGNTEGKDLVYYT